MIEDVIIARVQVSRKDDQQYFQVVLPRDTVKIKGIETGSLLLSDIPVNPANPISFLGSLQLQAEGQTNFCYCTDIFLDHKDAQIPALGFSGNHVFMKKAFEQSGMREPEPLEISLCHVLYGCYKDIIGQNLHADISYRVAIYIWIERIGFMDKAQEA